MKSKFVIRNTAILFLCCILMILESCGITESQPTSNPLLSKSSNTPTIDPAMIEKTQLAQFEQDSYATALVVPTAPIISPTPGELPLKPFPTPNLAGRATPVASGGVIITSVSFSSSLYKIINAWMNWDTQGHTTTVYAGYVLETQGQNPLQGVIVVRESIWTANGTELVGEEAFLTPYPCGKATIINATTTQPKTVYVHTDDGKLFLFNLETRRWITPITLVVANPAVLSESDQALQTFLAGRDYLPMLRTPSSITSTAVLTSHVVLLSASVSASVAQSQFRAAPIPVIAWNPTVYPALKLTTNAGTDSADQLVIDQPDHPLAAGLRDTVTLYDKAVDMPYGVPSANAITVGYALVNERGVPPRSSYFAYEKGAVMADGVVAPAKRVALPWSSDGTPSDEAWKLFDYAIQWAGMP